MRAESLADMIYSVSDNINSVLTIVPGDAKTFVKQKFKPIFLLDLMGCQQPFQQIIKNLKSELNNPKIIALHIYRTKSLVAPILNEGIDGYLYYEPSRAELSEALKNILNGNTYTPCFVNE